MRKSRISFILPFVGIATCLFLLIACILRDHGGDAILNSPITKIVIGVIFVFILIDGLCRYLISKRNLNFKFKGPDQIVLELPEGTTKKSVLAVGFNASMKPIAIVEESEGTVCYILPDWYSDWCTTCVEISMDGVSLFPSDVEFTKHGDEYAADILPVVKAVNSCVVKKES